MVAHRYHSQIHIRSQMHFLYCSKCDKQFLHPKTVWIMEKELKQNQKKTTQHSSGRNVVFIYSMNKGRTHEIIFPSTNEIESRLVRQKNRIEMELKFCHCFCSSYSPFIFPGNHAYESDFGEKRLKYCFCTIST